MKIIINFLPPVKHMLAGHSNLTEMKSYCQDVMQTADELKIKLSRFEANKHLFQ